MRIREELTAAAVIFAVSAWGCGSDDSGGGGGAGTGGKDGGGDTGALGGASGSGGAGGTGGAGGVSGSGASGGGASGGAGGAGTSKRVFVTSDDFAPDLGGALEGDAACQSVADSVSLGGTWMAWLSDDTTSPAQRFTQATIPYSLLDGTVVAASFAELISAQLSAPLNRDENNGVAGAVNVWTGTKPDGTAASDNCQSWTVAIASTGTRGSTDATNATWTDIGVTGCIQKQRLYCFEQ